MVLIGLGIKVKYSLKEKEPSGKLQASDDKFALSYRKLYKHNYLFKTHP